MVTTKKKISVQTIETTNILRAINQIIEQALNKTRYAIFRRDELLLFTFESQLSLNICGNGCLRTIIIVTVLRIFLRTRNHPPTFIGYLYKVILQNIKKIIKYNKMKRNQSLNVTDPTTEFRTRFRSNTWTIYRKIAVTVPT